ncbi:MAG TPA: ArsA-related P-loop ATPase [Acidimicrobiales bacterium]|nr:ArsA-related P-loop ATPase [Acidimicrobiales bacterium]
MSSEDTTALAADFRLPARVTIVAGKGGVGKTTVTGALAYLAAAAGRRVLVVEVEGKSGLSALFDHAEPLTYEETELWTPDRGLPGAVTARTLTPDDALLEYLEDRGMRRLSKRLTSTGTLDVIATAVPGIKDILVLGKVKQIEQRIAAGLEGAPDCIVVDAPAAGHAVTFLSSAYGLVEAASVGPIRNQAADVVSLLSDPDRCQVMLVTLPEETPVNEAVDTAFHLEDRAGVKLAPIVVNGLWPHLDLPADPTGLVGRLGLAPEEADRVVAAARFRRDRQAQQEEQVARLAEELPLPQLALPYLFTTELGLAEVRVLAAALASSLSALPGGGR